MACDVDSSVKLVTKQGNSTCEHCFAIYMYQFFEHPNMKGNDAWIEW